MKILHVIHSLSLLILGFVSAAPAASLGTAFTYQGRLLDGSSAANGNYDLRFILYDAANGGSQAGTSLTNGNVAVTNGLFTAAIDFGVGVFDGTAYWLEIGVRTNGSVVAFTPLDPRQPLTPTPYAIRASSAPWSGLTGVPAGFGDGVDNDTTYSAGVGLTLSGTTFDVNFGGNGVAGTVSRSDHNHNGFYALLAHTHSAADLVSGMLADGRLGGTYSGLLNLNNAGNTFAGSFAGNGAGLTGLNADNLASGTVANARLAASVALLDRSLQVFTGENLFNPGSDVAGLTVRQSAAGSPTADIFRVQNSAGATTYLRVDSSGQVSWGGTASGSISGDGSGLTSLNAGNITSGTLSAARIDSSIARDSEIFPAVLANDGTGSGLDADLLDGLDSGAFWQLGGNSGTTPGTHFLGTTDNQPLEFKINNARALRLEPNLLAPNIIGGADINTVAAGVGAATIAGGWNHRIRTNANYATIGGGRQNSILEAAESATIGGGYQHVVRSNALYATIAGGAFNIIGTNAHSATIGGGLFNWIPDVADYALIGGGRLNRIESAAHQSVIGGGLANTIQAQAHTATIAGGELSIIEVSAIRSFIGGGYQNIIRSNAFESTVGGGIDNWIGTNASRSVIGGGALNQIETGAVRSTIAGGQLNIIRPNAVGAVIGGGDRNTNSGSYATIPGGRNNAAAGGDSFAAGRRARANHNGAFVWADSTDADFESTAVNQFSVRASGGVRLETGGAGVTLDGQPVLSGSVSSAQIVDGSVSAADVNAATFGTTFWKTDGNTGTTPGTHFLGTTDNQALELKVNGTRALRLEPNATGPNVIGGNDASTINSTAGAATIGGGGFHTIQANANFTTIAGGRENTIQNDSFNSTIGGGNQNAIETNSHNATIAGGVLNRLHANSPYATIGGGRSNTIHFAADSSVIGGGALHIIQTNATYAVIAGGRNNIVGTNADYATVSGGQVNQIQTNAFSATIGGGTANLIRDDADYATIGGGTENTIETNADYATIPGGRYAKANLYGQLAYASGRFAGDGDAQTSTYVVRRSSTLLIPELFLDGGTRRLQVPAESCWAFDILIVGRRVNNECAAFHFRGLIDNTAGVTALVGTPIKSSLGVNGEFWDAYVEADDGNDALVIKGGSDGTSTRWVATVRTVEVTF